MTREQAQVIRLVLMCLAWSVGQALAIVVSFGPIDLLVPAALAAGVYALTDDLGRGGASGGGPARYWRGRRIDEDRRDGRWN